MTASSSGVEWSQLIKPILSAGSFDSICKQDILELAKSILKSKEDVLNHDEVYEEFYSCFSILVVDYFINNCNQVGIAGLNSLVAAAKVLIEYLIKRVGKSPLTASISAVSKESEEIDSETSSAVLNNEKEKDFEINDKLILGALKSLCCSSPFLHHHQQSLLVAVIKVAKLPPYIKTKVISQNGDKEVTVKETRRARADPSMSILEQLIAPLHDLSISKNKTQIAKQSAEELEHSLGHMENSDLKIMFNNRCIQSVQSLGGAEILIDVCLKLPTVEKYYGQFEEIKDGKTVNFFNVDVSSIRNSLKEMEQDFYMVWKIISLPILEPLSHARIEKLTIISMSAITCALNVAFACAASTVGAQTSVSKASPSTKEDEFDIHGVAIVESALDVYNDVLTSIQQSTRAGGHHTQNFQLMGSWLLLTGTYQIMTNISASQSTNEKKLEEKVRSPNKKDSATSKINLSKVQQGFNVFCVALMDQALKLLTALMEDVKIEQWSPESSCEFPDPAPLDPLWAPDSTGIEEAPVGIRRLARIFNSFPLNQLLFYLAAISYRKSCMLKKPRQRGNSVNALGDTFSISDSTTYYDDDFSEESIADDDEDSVIIGSWFDESLAPGEVSQPPTQSARTGSPVTTSKSPITNSQPKISLRKNLESVTMVPEKGEPHGYISLSRQIFTVMNNELLESDCEYVLSYMKNGLTDSHMAVFASVIKDLDKEMAKCTTGSLTEFLGLVLGSLYDDFSLALYRFTHNLIASNLLTENLQNSLLSHLGVSPWSQESDWPLQVLPRTLSVLTQILLLRQKKKKDELNCDADTACVLIWQRLVFTLTNSILSGAEGSSSEQSEVASEDLNVEHAQLLIFLFHSLQLMQKKNVLLNVASSLVKVSPVIQKPMKEIQIFHFSRLLLIFDYLMKNLYEAPQSLIDQVQYNLFKRPIKSYTDTENKDQVAKDTVLKDLTKKESAVLTFKDSNGKGRKFCHMWIELEGNLNKGAPSDDFGSGPVFYSLTPAELNTQEAPKLDGLACSFILATPDTLKYSTLYETLINFLSIIRQLDSNVRGPNDPELSLLGRSGVQYAFSLVFRVLMSMPPSIAALEAMEELTVPLDNVTVIHSLLWAPRVAHKVFNGWIKDGLVRQSLTTQKADSLLENVNSVNKVPGFEFKVVRSVVGPLVEKLKSSSDLPSFSELFLIDFVLSRLQVSVYDTCQKMRPNDSPNIFHVLNVEPSDVPLSSLFELIQLLTHRIRMILLQEMNRSNEDVKLNDEALEAYSSVLCLAGDEVDLVPDVLSKDLFSSALDNRLDEWNRVSMKDFPAVYSSWKISCGSDILPGESYVSSVLMGHISSLSRDPKMSVNPNLKHVMQTLVSFCSEIVSWYPEGDKNRSTLTSTLVSIAADATCDHVAPIVTQALSRKFLSDNSEVVLPFAYPHTFGHIEKILKFNGKNPGVFDDLIIEKCGQFLEQTLVAYNSKPILELILLSTFDMYEVFTPYRVSQKSDSLHEFYEIPPSILKFLTKFFQTAEKNKDLDLYLMSRNFQILFWIETGLLEKWLLSTCFSENVEQPPDAWDFLKAMASYAVAWKVHEDECGELCKKLLICLLSLGSTLLTLTDCQNGLEKMPRLLPTISLLASALKGPGHLMFFKSATNWLSKWHNLMSSDRDEELVLITLCDILSNIGDTMAALKLLNEKSGIKSSVTIGGSVPSEEAAGDTDSDWFDDISPEDYDEESGEEGDSDEEDISNRLCTYTLTQKDFMNQHWYHCHTCRMVDGVGVCSICAKVCHRGHDVTYAKYGSFFCDCGAKEEPPCQALVKRSSSSYPERVNTVPDPPSAFGGNQAVAFTLSQKQKASNTEKPHDEILKHRQALSKSLDSVREQISTEVLNSNIGSSVLDLLTELMSEIKRSALESSAIGTYQKTLTYLHQVHHMPKVVDHSESLMTATLGSQEGTFENVRLNYSGEQGQTIRQLISSHMIHRVSMSVMASPGSKRQHLAVAHEKGKVTILQLSSLLKQYDAKKKLTLTRLSSAPIPFTIVSISSNCVNDDYLAVCGLKDCHVLTFSSAGTVSDHLVLHPQLESGNYIIRAIWLPGQQCQLALVCADFVKIFDLSVDSLSPQYFFQMPTGKIKDVTFMSLDDKCHVIVMASSGYIYTQELCEQSSAKHGPFFVMNVLGVSHPDLKDVNGEVGLGGVSVYYSHTLQMLCFSYANGKSFLSPLTSINDDEELEKLFHVSIKNPNSASSSTNGSSRNNDLNNLNNPSATNVTSSKAISYASKSNAQPLYQWGEIPGHPGLITCIVQNNSWDGNSKSNSPVVLMIKPDKIYVQEIRISPSKSKLADFVSLRHIPSPEQEARTTMIILNEDGSLKIFGANEHLTNFWMNPDGKEESIMSNVRPPRKKKAPKANRALGSLQFPVDFLEHCSLINFIEFGGNDLLQIYNVQQLKNRLNGPSTFIASSKPGGFNLEVTNTESNLVMCAVRVKLGSVEIQKIPSYMTILGRTVYFTATRTRWFDVPLTREESLQADKNLKLVFGPSTDPSGFTIVDSVKIYGKSKDDFGWPEEAEEYTSNAPGSSGTIVDSTAPTRPPSKVTLSTTDRLVSCALETLDGYFWLTGLDVVTSTNNEAVDLATRLLNLPLPNQVQHHTKSLLASLHPSKVAYHNHKDSSQLQTVVEGLSQLNSCKDPKMLDCETFHRLLITARNVAVKRPQNLVKFLSLKMHLELFGEKKNDSVDTLTHESPQAADEAQKISVDLSPREKSPVKISAISDKLMFDLDKSDNSDTPSTFKDSEMAENKPKCEKDDKADDSSSDPDKTLEIEPKLDEPPFLNQLMSVFWSLLRAKPSNSFLSSVCQPGLSCVEQTVHALVEIINAFTLISLQTVPYAVNLYTNLLLSENLSVSFSAKQALIKVLRPTSKKKKSNTSSAPRCSTPGENIQPATANEQSLFDIQPPFDSSGSGRAEESMYESVADELDEDLRALGAAGVLNEGAVADLREGNLEGALMDGLMNLQGDDDAMVEFAIALSLHDGDNQASGQDRDRSLPSGLEDLVGEASRLENLVGGHGSLEGLVGGLPGLRQLHGLSGQVLHSLLNAGNLQNAAGQNNDQDVEVLNLTMEDNGADELEGDPEEDEDDEEEENDVAEEHQEDPEQLSDTTVSANGSDDEDGEGSNEGSNAATDGGSNLMMASPAEQVGSGGSESGASVADSYHCEHNVSGRSSMFGDQNQEAASTSKQTSEEHPINTNLQGIAENQPEGVMLHNLRLNILDSLVLKIPKVMTVGGVRSIPFLQVILMLTTDIDGNDSRDKKSLESVLDTLLEHMELNKWDLTAACERTPNKEVQLVILKLLGVMMSRSKHGSKSAGSDSSVIPNITAGCLINGGALEHCLNLLEALLNYWKNVSKESQPGTIIGGNLLKNRSSSPAPDMAPFFLKQYVKGNAHDIFSAFPQFLTEMLLRLPYQIKKLSENKQLDALWCDCLCEYAMTQQTLVVKRQVRKLLLYASGSKETYRQMRDFHALDFHMKDIKALCTEGGFLFSSGRSTSKLSLSYDSLIQLVEHLKACVEIATSRTSNWQWYCVKDENVLGFFMEVSYLLEEGVAPIVLQLLQAAICTKDLSSDQGKSGASSSKSTKKSTDDEKMAKSLESAGRCSTLVAQINRNLDKTHLSVFIYEFMLESNLSNVRWQAHALLYALYRYSSPKDQEYLLTVMWGLWPGLPAYGSKAAQFVDLLGYFSLKTKHCERKVLEYLDSAVEVLRSQSIVLYQHPNATLYESISSLVEFDGYYLESEPCLVCSNPEVSFASVKLTTIKVDSRYTTKTQLVKLVGSHMISRLSLRITDLKRSKMVRTMNIYYNNKSVQAIVELKNKPTMWNKAKTVSLSAGQTEVKVDFPLPIIGCNIMIEYADFYENLQASTETLLCPRCSAAVPASPGVCGNCGENVYQCHKCRAINYDEKDPFLCNSCGYCKYAKFDYSLNCRPCCAVDAIEGEEDRNKAVLSIDTLLEKADKAYKQLQSYKPSLEAELCSINDQAALKVEDIAPTGNHVNKSIQMLAQKYCGDCKNAFDELSKIIQKVQASRKQLIAYDKAQKYGGRKIVLASNDGASTSFASMEDPPINLVTGNVSSKCYGCAAAATQHCVTLLKAMATNSVFRKGLYKQGLLQDLLDNNLKRGTVQIRNDVKHLICLLTKDDFNAALELNELIMDRLMLALNSHAGYFDLSLSVRHEMSLLAASANLDDSCWEHRLRCVAQIMMASGSNPSPMIMESITLPCLRILQGMMKPPKSPPPQKSKDKSILAPSTAAVMNVAASNANNVSSNIIESHIGVATVGVDMQAWLACDPEHSFESWQKRYKHTVKEAKVNKMSKEEVRKHYLMEKFGCIWLSQTLRRSYELKLSEKSWLKRVLFNPSSKMARQVAAQIVLGLCTTSHRKKEVLNLLTSFLSEISKSGENSAEFVALFQTLVAGDEWKNYLALKGILPLIADLIMEEINRISLLEDTSLTTDLSQGYSLKILTEILSTFVEVESIKRVTKSKLLATVLTSYLSLRKLVVQRTKLIDDTQKKFLELLEGMTSGTEDETREFMGVCLDAVKKYPVDDFRIPVFIFERLCSIIYPEVNEVGEFFVTLEKDPQQEDFLQGRMIGNPYSSLDPGLGPLLRDVKNKICQDCELVALLDDDSGMELLICNKIISLDLPVKEVYKKVWLAENRESDPMRVVYRMRGLLGDATEEFIESLEKKNEQDVDNEQVFRMASVMNTCSGLEVMLEFLERVTDLSHAKPLVTVLMKLFQYCVKLKENRRRLTDPSVGAVSTLLYTLKQCLAAEPEMVTGAVGGPTLTEQVLSILETIMMEACAMSSDRYQELVETCGTLEDIHLLLNYVGSSRTNTQVRQLLLRVLPFLVFCHKEKMELLVGHFKPVLDFETFDTSHTAEEEAKIEAFCVFCQGIERNSIGNQLKDMILRANIVRDALSYLDKNTPKSRKLVVVSDEECKAISKPSLKYVLRLLAGLSWKHPGTQTAVAESAIPAIHSLEQISSDERVGSLAENLLEALKDNSEIAKKIKETRQLTRQEKKQLAMKTRKKELQKLGLKANEKQQITSDSSLLRQIEEITEEAGLACAICLEGYRCQPQKVLAIYTFSKKCVLDSFENKSHKTPGYCTVSHFNVVHVDCHLAAVRASRSRDEWDSAALHNANTKTNGLLPLWGPQIPESAFASCLARHNTYLQESTSHRDLGYISTMQDVKLLFIRYATEKSLSADSGGGGPQSNMNLIPYLLHMALYVMNTTRSSRREQKRVEMFIESNVDATFIDFCFNVEGPQFITVLSIIVLPLSRWRDVKLTFLKRLLLLNHVRSVATKPPTGGKITNKSVKDWNVYKSACLMWSLVNSFYCCSFKNVSGDSSNWSTSLAEFIRHNDQSLLESASQNLQKYQQDLIPCASFPEFCDVAELLGDISNPDEFLKELIESLP